MNIKGIIRSIGKRITLSKINFLNHKFKKFIVKYEVKDNKIKVYNSNGDYKLVDNTIQNKVKIMEIVKEHEKVINDEIEYYYNNKEDYKIVLFISLITLIVFGFFSLFTFFIGNYYLLILSIILFLSALFLYVYNFSRIYIFREEIKRLESIKEGRLVLNEDEIYEFFKDLYIIIKDYVYNLILKIMNVKDRIKVKTN